MMKRTLCIKSFIAASAIFLAVSAGAAPYPQSYSPEEIAKQRKAGADLQLQLKQALDSGKTSLDIPRGIYRMDTPDAKGKAFISIVRKQNFTLNGNHSLLLLEKDATAITVYACKNVSVKNFSVDYDPLPFTQGSVISVDEKKSTFIFRPAEGYDAFCAKMFGKGLRGILFSSGDRRMKIGQTGFGLAMREKLPNGDYSVQIRGFYGYSPKVCGFAAGDLVTIFSRTSHAVKTEVSENTIFENIDLFSAHFIGYVANVGLGGHKYLHCRIVKREGTDRLMSGNADGFNAANLKKGPTLERCEIDTIGDDFVNFHGVYCRVFEQLSPTELVVQGFAENFEQTPSLVFLDAESYAYLGTRRVSTLAPFSYVIPDKRNDSLKTKWAAAGNFKPGQKIRALKITLDQPLNLKNMPIFSSLSAVSSGSVIRNCVFRNSLARGIRLQSRNSLIENNLLDRVQGPHFTTAGQPGYWGESITSADLVIRNNRFIEGEIDAKSRFPGAIVFSAPGGRDCDPVRNVLFTGNTILRSGAAAIAVSNAVNITVTENTIQEFKGKKWIVISDSSDVKVSGNRIK